MLVIVVLVAAVGFFPGVKKRDGPGRTMGPREMRWGSMLCGVTNSSANNHSAVVICSSGTPGCERKPGSWSNAVSVEHVSLALQQ